MKILKNKNILFVLISLISFIAFFLLTYMRYNNQNILIREFSLFKTGNLITLALFIILTVFITINIISNSKYNIGSLIILLILSFAGLFFLIISYLFTEKDFKIFTSITFLIIYGFQFTAIVNITFSRSKKLHFFNNLGLMILVALICFLMNLAQIYYYKDDFDLYNSGNKKADAGIILGAAVWGGNRPSPVLRERINKGFEIYQKKFVGKLVLTGGGSPNEMTEADVAKNELKKYGVDEKNLIAEVKSNSTIEQIHYVRDKCYKRYNWNKIILISDNYHLFRSSEICKFNNMNVDCIASDTPLSTEGVINYCIKESVAVFFFWVFGIG
jgi:vancomycin permeability regulator SanA